MSASEGGDTEDMTNSPATWENVVVGEAKKLAGELVGDEELEEQGADQVEAAREVHKEYREERAEHRHQSE
jgi:uncharacterized protein YjbJ (UPF0337 family)